MGKRFRKNRPQDTPPAAPLATAAPAPSVAPDDTALETPAPATAPEPPTLESTPATEPPAEPAHAESSAPEPANEDSAPAAPPSTPVIREFTGTPTHEPAPNTLTIRGNLVSSGPVAILQNATLTGDLTASEAIVAGHVGGRIEVGFSIILSSGARVDGPLSGNALLIEQDVTFRGPVRIGTAERIMPAEPPITVLVDPTELRPPAPPVPVPSATTPAPAATPPAPPKRTWFFQQPGSR